MNHIEEWWRHNGTYDREMASDIPFDGKDTASYLDKTDKWWDSLTDEQKKRIYEDFFDEC